MVTLPWFYFWNVNVPLTVQSTGQSLLNSCKLENDSNQFVPTSLYLCELLKEHHTNPLCFIINKISRMVNFIFYFYLSTCVGSWIICIFVKSDIRCDDSSPFMLSRMRRRSDILQKYSDNWFRTQSGKELKESGLWKIMK